LSLKRLALSFAKRDRRIASRGSLRARFFNDAKSAAPLEYRDQIGVTFREGHFPRSLRDEIIKER
jgi:hypothetical protein